MSVSEYIGWQCAFCGADNETEIDMSAGHHQEIVEECNRCSRPNLLVIEVDQRTQEIRLESHAENE